MTDRRAPPLASPEGYGWDHEANRRRQRIRGLELTPAARLRWLEEAMRELWGAARRARHDGASERRGG
ncbi:MAG: hypothetical protein IT376_10770 [Polyangiaceae bacterium]|nr:hypothetical protein [Polyangiaceae bacterium]